VSSTPGRSRLAEVARLVRQADAAEAAGRAEEAVSFLEVVRLDPGDKRALHRLGDLQRIRFKRFPEAARCYAAEARSEERDDFPARALALWRLVVRCDAARLDAHERIGALCVAHGRVADARAHYVATARHMERAGHAREAAIQRAHLAALAGWRRSRRSAGPPPVLAAPDDNAIDLAADRFQNGRFPTTTACTQQARATRGCW
jgi:hypothetical protein